MFYPLRPYKKLPDLRAPMKKKDGKWKVSDKSDHWESPPPFRDLSLTPFCLILKHNSQWFMAYLVGEVSKTSYDF